MYGSFYRHVWFPFFDRVKGRNTVAYWREFEESQWWPRERHEAQQLHALRNLLGHAKETCPYYHALATKQGLISRGLDSFEEFRAWPLLTKDVIRNHRQALRTTQPLKTFSKSTGGSSGEPLHFDLNLDSNDRRTALMYRGYGWAGGAPGTKQLHVWGGPLANVPTWKRWKMALHQSVERKTTINCFEFTPELMQKHLQRLNRYRPDVIIADDDRLRRKRSLFLRLQVAGEFIQRLNRYRPDVIIAYTTPLYEFARYLQAEKQTPFSPKSIIVGAEKLHGFQRKLIEQVFGAPVFETYGSREFMLIGGECERHAGLHLSMENLYVEILDEHGHPTPAGDEGNVVITDLFNYGLPFIRYVNGDRAVAGWEMCACGRGLPLLQQVVGRQLDTLTTPSGQKVPGEFFPHLMKEFSRIRRFQVVQEVPEVISLKLVAPGFTADEEADLRDAVAACIGTDAKLEIKLVEDIPLTGAGKLQVVVNKIRGQSAGSAEPVSVSH